MHPTLSWRVATAWLFAVVILVPVPWAANSGTGEGLEPIGYSAPALRTWSAATFPAGIDGTDNGSVVVRIAIDEIGKVTTAAISVSSRPEFDAAALDAVKQWKFDPARLAGKSIPSSFEVAVRVARPGRADATVKPTLLEVSRSAAVLRSSPLGEFPVTLNGRGLPGTVTFRCTVMPDGTSANLCVLRASHADFVLPAIQSSSQWQFAPGSQGDLAVPTDVIGEVYYIDPQLPERGAVLGANGITAPDGSVPENAPRLVGYVEPVFPHERLTAGEGGSAAVEFVVCGNGAIRDVRVREATHPDFGAALAAAVQCWTFDAAIVRGKSIDVGLIAKKDFPPVPATAPSEGWLPRLAALVRANAIAGGAGLDERLRPLYRVMPTLPQPDLKGEAIVEFVIDRDGRARLPRVVKTSDPALGWAAATAVSQWVFKAPTRGGSPTEVKVQIPIGI